MIGRVSFANWLALRCGDDSAVGRLAEWVAFEKALGWREAVTAGNVRARLLDQHGDVPGALAALDEAVRVYARTVQG